MENTQFKENSKRGEEKIKAISDLFTTTHRIVREDFVRCDGCRPIGPFPHHLSQLILLILPDSVSRVGVHFTKHLSGICEVSDRLMDQRW
jgi:hypothetical protein